MPSSEVRENMACWKTASRPEWPEESRQEVSGKTRIMKCPFSMLC